jgi:hypothetical protein
MTIGIPLERNLLASLNALGAVDVIEEIPIRSAFSNSFQSGSDMSSIKVFALYPLSFSMVDKIIVPNLGSAVRL